MDEILLLADQIAAYESNRLNEQEIISLFQTLANNNLLDELPGIYWRRAMAMVRAGFLTLPC